MNEVLDLFAGPGGWSEGLRMLGLSDIGIEWDAAACATRKAAGHLTIRADVAAYPTEPFVGKVTGLIASPPCQDFSLAGKRAGLDGDRGQLVWQVIRWADALRPAWIACEQVPPVLDIWRHMAHTMRGWGYKTWTGILNAADYGVPQTRRRAFLLARLDGPVGPPEPTHGQDAGEGDLFGGSLLPWVSMAEALGWGMSARPSVTVTAGGGRQGGPDPLEGGSGARETLKRERREGRWMVRDSFGTPSDDYAGRQESRWKDAEAVPSPAVTSKTRDWAVTRPATTVCADPRIFPPEYRGGRRAYEDGLGDDPSQRAGTNAIRVSADEAALLQSFPVDYPWQGSRTKQFEQIGNAIPPLLAAHVLSLVTGIELSEDVAA